MSSRSMLPTLDRVCVERSEPQLKTTKESRYCKLFLAKKRERREQSRKIVLYHGEIGRLANLHMKTRLLKYFTDETSAIRSSKLAGITIHVLVVLRRVSKLQRISREQ